MISVKGNLTGKLNTTYTKIYPELENLTVTPSEEQQKFIHEDRYGYDKVVVNPIPDKYIIPSGALDITENGNYNVKEKEFANVNVPTKTLRTKTITTNGTYLAIDDGVDGYSEVEVATSGVDINDYFNNTIRNATLDTVECGNWLNYIKKLPQNVHLDEYTTTCNKLFAGYPCHTLDLSSFDTSNVTKMNGMFFNCKSLTSLDLSNFNTVNVTDIGSMFYGCNELSSLNLSNFNTSNVTNMNYMFYSSNKLISLDLSSFNTINVTSMNGMFFYCSSLTNLDLSSFNTINVTSMRYMFQHCSSLTNLDLSSFNTAKVTNMSGMFYGCLKLKNLNISNFDFTKVKSHADMFVDVSDNCYILVKDAEAKEWITSKFTNLTNVHYVGEIE